MKVRNSNPAVQHVSRRNEYRLPTDLGTAVRKLHKDYKLALAMTLAGKTDAEIVAELKVKGIDEAALQHNMEWLRRTLRIDSFEDPVLRSRPVRRALKDYWAYGFGPE